jgi:hypothetical protein
MGYGLIDVCRLTTRIVLSWIVVVVVGCCGLSDGFVYSLVAFGFGDFFE